MNIISLEDVSKDYGFGPLFTDVTLGFEDTDKIGVIGANGSGKTTLLGPACKIGIVHHKGTKDTKKSF